MIGLYVFRRYSIFIISANLHVQHLGVQCSPQISFRFKSRLPPLRFLLRTTSQTLVAFVLFLPCGKENTPSRRIRSGRLKRSDQATVYVLDIMHVCSTFHDNRREQVQHIPRKAQDLHAVATDNTNHANAGQCQMRAAVSDCKRHCQQLKRFRHLS